MCRSYSLSYLFLSNFYSVCLDMFVVHSKSYLSPSPTPFWEVQILTERGTRMFTRERHEWVQEWFWDYENDEKKHWVSNLSPKNNFSVFRTWDQRRTSLLGPPRRPPPLRWRPRFSQRLLLPLNPYKLLSIPCFRKVSLGLRLKIVSCKIIASN